MLPKECTFTFSVHQRARFRSGQLVREWHHRYPELVDDDDARILEDEAQRQYHFYEFLCAVIIYESTGYLSIVEKYTTKCHKLKRGRLSKYVPPFLFDWLCENESGQPDLFIFDPVGGDWCFREVKGPGDAKRPVQIDWERRFEQLLSSRALDHRNKLGTIRLTVSH